MSKIALVTDWITVMGGGEKVVEQFHKLYPDAPIYTSYCADRWRPWLDNKVVTGYLQHWPFSVFRRFLPVLRQWWFARLDLSAYDTIISISGNGEAKFVKTADNQTHICYCHTPPHFYWAQYDEYLRQPSMRPFWLARLGLKLLVKPLRKRDYVAAQQVDYFIANSTNIQNDIKRFYHQESVVVHPPINTDMFTKLAPQGTRVIPEIPQCITWGRVVPAKRIDVAIEACNQLGWPLTIIGDGPDIPRLKALAGPTITLAGYVNDEDREKYIKSADLFLFCAYEDFGVAPVEALAAGLPVVAYHAGGALDYVVADKNGAFFDEQTPESIMRTLKALPNKRFTTESVSSSVQQFSVTKFSNKISAYINQISK